MHFPGLPRAILTLSAIPASIMDIICDLSEDTRITICPAHALAVYLLRKLRYPSQFKPQRGHIRRAVAVTINRIYHMIILPFPSTVSPQTTLISS